ELGAGFTAGDTIVSRIVPYARSATPATSAANSTVAPATRRRCRMTVVWPVANLGGTGSDDDDCRTPPEVPPVCGPASPGGGVVWNTGSIASGIGGRTGIDREMLPVNPNCSASRSWLAV